jgi:hypothetical protein
MAEINDWNIAAASNNASPPDGWPEGMSYANVNNSAREGMAVVARWHKDNNGSLTASSGGGGAVYTLAANQVLSAYYTGLTLAFRVDATNVASPTLNVDSVGAAAIWNHNGEAIGVGVMVAGSVYRVVYDGTRWRLENGARSLSQRRQVETGVTSRSLASTDRYKTLAVTLGQTITLVNAALEIGDWVELVCVAGNFTIAQGDVTTFQDNASSPTWTVSVKGLVKLVKVGASTWAATRLT